MTFRSLLTRHVFRGIGSGFKGVYAKLVGVWGHAPLQNFSNLGVQKCHFLRFPLDISLVSSVGYGG